ESGLSLAFRCKIETERFFVSRQRLEKINGKIFLADFVRGDSAGGLLAKFKIGETFRARLFLKSIAHFVRHARHPRKRLQLRLARNRVTHKLRKIGAAMFPRRLERRD